MAGSYFQPAFIILPLPRKKQTVASSHTPLHCADRMKKNFKGSPARATEDRRTVLARILDTPHLERVVPQMQPELLHRVIQSCGLEDCGELVMLATPGQLARIFDLDLWQPAEPGMDDRFDADRFGVWLEVLAESGAGAAAQKLASMSAALVIAGLAQHVRVFDGAVVTPYRTTDGIEVTPLPDIDGLVCDVGGYRVVAKRTDSWDAIVEILIALDAEHSGYFDTVMRGCRALSNAGYEVDGLDDLLVQEQQAMFDLELDREHRRDRQGYVTPAQARAFLEMSRRVQLESAAMPPENPLARAYFRSLNQRAADRKAPGDTPSAATGNAAAALADVLLEAGIIAQPPRALLKGSQDTADELVTLRHIREHMQLAFDRDHAAYARRNEELTYLANTVMAGCALQGRPFTAQEAWDAAVAVCNLGLENWPPLWSPPDGLVTVFQAGWTVLHEQAGIFAARRLLEILAGLQCSDRDIQNELHALRIKLSAACRSGTPWLARGALDVIAILDTTAWAALLGLIAEFPVLHAAAGASAFEFISENSQITVIRKFIQSLPEMLR